MHLLFAQTSESNAEKMTRVTVVFAAIFASAVLTMHCFVDCANASLLDELENMGVNRNKVSRIVLRGLVGEFPFPITAEIAEVGENHSIWLELGSPHRYDVWEHDSWRSIDFYVVGDEISPSVTVDVNATGEAHVRGKSPRSGGYASPGLLQWVVRELSTRLDHTGSLVLQREDGTVFLEGDLISCHSIIWGDRDLDGCNAVFLLAPMFRAPHDPGFRVAHLTRSGGDYKINLSCGSRWGSSSLHGTAEGNQVRGKWRDTSVGHFGVREIDRGVFELELRGRNQEH